MGIIGLGCLIGAGILTIWAAITRKRNTLVLMEPVNNPRIALLIPARDESAVIEGLLKSIRSQSYPLEMDDVYVIVEDLDDPTVKLCRQYGVSVILRQNVEKQRKGYALDEAVREILRRKHYDLYFIFDADNILKKDFIKKMLQDYQKGYQIVTGYRNAKNGDANVIAAASSLTFSMINGIGNRKRLKQQANMTFSGTGLYVDGRLVEEWQGWPFHSLTEDYELSLYATLRGLATYYDENAVFFDEQPRSYQQTVAQRTRWIKGYFTARWEYIPKIRERILQRLKQNNYGSLVKVYVGVKPIILLIAGLILIAIDGMVWLGVNYGVWWVLIILLGLVGVVYGVLLILTLVIIKSEKLKMSRSMKLKVILFNPLYLVTYVPCAVKALLKKNVVWTKIQHGG